MEVGSKAIIRCRLCGTIDVRDIDYLITQVSIARGRYVVFPISWPQLFEGKLFLHRCAVCGKDMVHDFIGVEN